MGLVALCFSRGWDLEKINSQWAARSRLQQVGDYPPVCCWLGARPDSLVVECSDLALAIL